MEEKNKEKRKEEGKEGGMKRRWEDEGEEGM